jgi:hypothetical protein
MLVKLTPRVNFTNIFTCSFCARRSRQHKKTDNFTGLFTLLSSEHAKAARKTLMKLTPGEGQDDTRIYLFVRDRR